MIAKAYARFIRVSPRKLRQIVNVIKGKCVYDALSILANLNKRSKIYIEEVLRSAVANAKRDPNVKDENLFISRMIVNGGPMLKRYKAASMGRAVMIRRRTSHITVELDVLPVKVPKIQEMKVTKQRKPKRERRSLAGTTKR